MTPAPKKKKEWPKWGVSPEGNRAIFHCLGDVPHGWTVEGEPKIDPAVPGEASPGLAAWRVAYKSAFGKKPSPKWDAETLRKKIAEMA